MCELRCHQYAPLEKGWHGTLPLQRLWSLLQDERTEQAAHQTQKKTGKFEILILDRWRSQ